MFGLASEQHPDFGNRYRRQQNSSNKKGGDHDYWLEKHHMVDALHAKIMTPARLACQRLKRS